MFYALVSLGLLLDGAYLFRIVLFCCAVHEAGHAAAYIICTHRLPKIVVSAGGVCLKKTAYLTRRQMMFVLCMGPIFNFVLFAALYYKAQQNATYSAYIIAAASVCVGLYNLLPVGALDGAQIVELFLSAKHLLYWHKYQKALIAFLCVFLPVITFVIGMPTITKIAAFVAPVYLYVHTA